MLKMLISTAALLSAGATFAQNDMAPVLGAGDGAAPVIKTVAITALGAYANDGDERLIEVQADADTDSDGTKDKGLLRVSCNGGDIVSGGFQAGATAAAISPKPKMVKAAAASPLAAGKTFKVKWNLRDVTAASQTGAAVPLTLASGQPDICA